MRLLPLALAAATAVAATDLEPRNLHCAKGVHVIALGGQGTTKGDMGYLTTLVTNITHRIPHSNYEQIGYPKGATPPEILAYAEPKLRKRLHNYRKKCPHTKIVLASYSMGAASTMNVLCGNSSTGRGDLPASYLKNIMANVVYGDLTFVPNKPYDRGTCQFNGLVPRQHPEKCAPFGRKTRSYCDYDDVNCCSGHDQAVHFSYPGKYDIQASQHVHARFRNHQKWLKKHGHHGKHHHKHHGRHHHKKHHHKGGKN